MVEVYIVHSGCIYEGGVIDAVFKSEEKAIWWVKNYVRKYNKRQREGTNPRRAFNKGRERATGYVRDNHCRWTRASGYISVIPWKVI